MIKTISVLPGVTLRCVPDTRFKQHLLSIRFVGTVSRETIPQNALLPEVLLRGCKSAPDLRRITMRLDTLYGASVGPLSRREGDYHLTGLTCGFIGDRYCMEPEGILEPMVTFLGELLLDPVTENGVFSKDIVESEKTNLISAIEALRNNKRGYASAQLFRHMCGDDPYGIPRLGEVAQVKTITPESLYAYYRTVLREYPVEVFYVGAEAPERIAALIQPLFRDFSGTRRQLPPQRAYTPTPEGDYEEKMDVAQGKLCMGFYTPIHMRTPEFTAMQLCNTILGGGMTSKLFTQIREKQSLCYDISSGYFSSKGILTVSAGIDFDKKKTVKAGILEQLEACARGQITPEELTAAKEAMYTALYSTMDSPGAMESYCTTSQLGGFRMLPHEHRAALEKVTVEQVAAAARSLKLHTVYFLRGEQ